MNPLCKPGELTQLDPAWLADFESKHGAVKRKLGKPKVVKPPEPASTEKFAEAWQAAHTAPLMVRELVFHPEVGLSLLRCPCCDVERPLKLKKGSRAWTRDWRFDFAWPDRKLALEVDGWGRHQSYVGYRGDCEKLNSALLHGWRVLRVMASEVKHLDQWVSMVHTALALK